MRVYVGCFGSGLGHATRMLGVAETLVQRGHVVRFSSSDEVASFIEGRGYGCNRLPLADVRYADDGALSLRKTMAASPLTLARTYRQLSLELSNIKRFRPDAVLCDSALATVLAGRMLGVRTYTVLNQLNLSAPSGGGAASTLLSEGTSAGLAKFWELSDCILLPDLPPPYTISESNLRRGSVGDMRFIGFLVNSDSAGEDEAASAFVSDRRPKVFWPVSGPPRTREPFVRVALEMAHAFENEYCFVVTEGEPSGSRIPTRMGGGWRYGWCDIPQFYFRACDVVVSRAGHGTVAQAIIGSRPSLLVPIPNQTEQEGNATKAVSLGVSVALRQDKLDADSFGAAMTALRSGPYHSRAAELGRIARSYDARKAIVELIEGSAS